MRALKIEAMLLGIALGLSFLSYKEIKRIGNLNVSQGGQLDEVLYLPRGEALEFLSFGYRQAFANLLWFNTINYFGKHYASDQNYMWLYHMCDIVTTLDPLARHVYEFGSTMLSWEVNKPEEALLLLDKAIRSDPTYWKYFYYRGFVHMFFMKDPAKAKDDFIAASKLPNAHYIAARLAAKNLSGLDQTETAVSFLSDMLKATSDPAAREALDNRLREAIYENDLRKLEKAAALFEEKTGAFPNELADLQRAGLIGSIPPDPFGGKYLIEPDARKITSSSGRKRLRIYGHPEKPAEGGGLDG